MPPPPQTFSVLLARSDSRMRLRTFCGAPFRLLITSPDDLSGVVELRAEIHRQRKMTGQQPLAVSSATNPTGFDVALDFTWDQMVLPLQNQLSQTFYVLLRATLANGKRDVYELGTVEVLSNPVSDMAPPTPEARLYATADFVAGSTAAEATLREDGDAVQAARSAEIEARLAPDKPLAWFAARAAAGAAVNIRLVGDSTWAAYLAGGTYAPDPAATTQAALRSYFNNTAVTVTNNAVSAKGTTWGLSVLPGLLTAAAAQTLFVISLMTNDCTGLVSEETKTAEQYAANLRTMVLMTRAAGHTPVLETGLPLLAYGALGDQDRAGNIAQYARAMRQVARELNVPFIDTCAHFEMMLQSGVSPSLLFSDGIHLTALGYLLRAYWLANALLMSAPSLPADGVLPAVAPAIRHYGGTNAVISAAGSATGWGRVARSIRVPVLVTAPRTDIALLTPFWVSGATVMTVKVNGAVAFTGTLKAALLAGFSFPVDHRIMIRQNAAPGFYFVEMDASDTDCGLYGVASSPTRAAPASSIGQMTATTTAGGLQLVTGAGQSGINNALGGIPISCAIRSAICEVTAALGDNQGFFIHGTPRADGAAPLGGVLLFLYGGTGRLSVATGAGAGYDGLQTLGNSDLRGVEHVYRLVAAAGGGSVGCYVDGVLIGTYTPSIPYVGGQVGLYGYGPSVTVKARRVEVF